MEVKKPTLVIWQTGTVDAIRSIDPDDFRTAVDDGVAALQNSGADVVLMNLQYSPRTETMISAPPYLDNMRVVAQQHDVPLFDRFAIMRQWNDSGDFDLFSASHGVELAKRVHDCLAARCRNLWSTRRISARPSRIEDLALMSCVSPFAELHRWPCRGGSAGAADAGIDRAGARAGRPTGDPVRQRQIRYRQS